jgi:hypothetical protein
MLRPRFTGADVQSLPRYTFRNLGCPAVFVEKVGSMTIGAYGLPKSCDVVGGDNLRLVEDFNRKSSGWKWIGSCPCRFVSDLALELLCGLLVNNHVQMRRECQCIKVFFFILDVMFEAPK